MSIRCRPKEHINYSGRTGIELLSSFYVNCVEMKSSLILTGDRHNTHSGVEHEKGWHEPFQSIYSLFIITCDVLSVVKIVSTHLSCLTHKNEFVFSPKEITCSISSQVD